LAFAALNERPVRVRMLVEAFDHRGGEGEDDACVLVSEMEKVTRVLAVTALDVCRRKPGELATALRA
jgi:hypothetical protein